MLWRSIITRHTFAQNNFTAGKLGKQVHARTDVDDYKNGVDDLENFIPYRAGGVRLRPGVRVIERIEVLDADPGLVQHQLEADGKFYSLFISKTDTGSPFFVREEDIYDNRVSKSKVTLGLGTDPLKDAVRVLSLNATLNFPQQTSRFVIATAPDPLTWTLLQAQNQYLLVNTTGLYEPLILLRYDDGTGERWHISEFINTKLIRNPQFKQHSAYALGYPYEVNRDTEFNLVRLGTDVDTFQVQGPPGFFDAGFEDSFLRVVPPLETDDCTFYIESYDGGDLITVNKIEGNQADWVDLGNTSAWHYSDWNHNDGWPKLVTSYNQRITFANSTRYPNKLWLTSQLDSFILTVHRLYQDDIADNSGLNYWGDISDGFAFSLVMASNDLLEVTWMSPQTELLVGTKTGEFRVGGDDGKFGPLTRHAILQTHHGSRQIQGQNADRAVLFVSKEGRDVKQLGFSNDAKAYVIRNLATLVQGIVSESKNTAGDIEVSIKKLIWIAEDYTCWVLLTNGKLIGFVKEDVWQVLAWYNFEANPDLFIEDIEEFKQKDLDRDELRFVARGNTPNQFYTGIVSQDYLSDTAVFYPQVSNEHPLQYRYLDYNAVDTSDAILDVDVGDYDDILGNYTIRGTGVVNDLERFTYNGPSWGTILDGDIVYAIAVDYGTDGELEVIQLSDTLQNAIDAIPLLPPAPSGAGSLTGAGFEAVVDRFGLSDFGKEVLILGAVVTDMQYIKEEAWNLDNPAKPIVELDNIYKTINYGYKYKGFIKSLNFESQPIGQYADKQVMFKRIDRVLFKMDRAYNCMVGSSEENMYPMEFPVEFTPTGIEFYRGDVVHDWDASAGEQQRILIEAEGYGPVGVLGLFVRAFMGDT